MNYETVIFEIEKLNISGNIVPLNWFKTIRHESKKEKAGKPYLLAINILSDIVYWYRPRKIRDEMTGELIGYEKRFKADMLQRSYQQFSEMFGCSKREATNAITRLEKIGVLKRHFRTIRSEEFVANNVLFIELIPSKLEELTFTQKACDPMSPNGSNTTEVGGSHFQKGEGLTFKRERVPLSKGTQIQRIQTENTNKNIKKERKEENARFSQEVKSDKKENLDSTQVSDSAINGKKISDSKKSKTFDQLIEEYTTNEELRQELKEHLKVRKLKKAALTDRAVELSLSELDKIAGADYEKIQIVRNSIMNGWTGFFPLKKDEHNRLLSSLSRHTPSYDIEAYERSSRAIFGLADDWAADDWARESSDNTEKKYKFKSWDGVQ